MDAALNLARRQPERYVVVYQDEATFYRQPSQGWLWAVCGRYQPRMPYSHRSNTRMRVVGYLDGVTGAVRSQDMDSVTADRLAKSVARLSAWYPRAEKIYLVWDNWPVHSHPRVEQAIQDQSRVHLLPLPTYAPWLNPIEKLWRWTRQRVAHAHPWCDDFREFRRHIRTELDALIDGSPDLRAYVGL